MAELCVRHQETVALYRCEGCQSLLCGECAELGHALIFCRLCGERAMLLASDRPASSREARRREVLVRPYGLGQALLYPFRGFGRYLFLAALVCKWGIEFLVRYSFGCFSYALAAGFWSLLVGLQLKIARSSAEGGEELPDWPDYFSWGERMADILVYLVIQLWQYGLVALYVALGWRTLVAAEPSLPFWFGLAVLFWLGTAAGMMAFGAAGRFLPDNVLRIDRHVRAFRACGSDAVRFTNLLFGIGALVWLARIGLKGIPIAGGMIAGILGTYWIFVAPHLAGLLFRRHLARLEEIY
ncbi:MAG TPA: B-box zinc finger protein [Thermoanaerobaculia bacterium]|nr:B-box zinc finger protein [Thermoanaerobaculia bacterium]